MNGTALLLSIKPRFADAIFSRQKRVELRRVKPRVGPGDLVLVYVSLPRCALEGAFEVERVLQERPAVLWRHVEHNAGVTRDEFDDYFTSRDMAYAIVIRRVWRLTPVTLSSLRRAKIRPPQNYQYLDQPKTGGLGLNSTSDWPAEGTLAAFRIKAKRPRR